MRTPPPRLGGKGEAPGTVPTGRIILSILGLLLGIAASFIVTGIKPAPHPTPVSQTANSGDASAKAIAATEPSVSPQIEFDFSWRRVWTIGLIALVICGLTYQGLYFSLRLYEGQPALLVGFAAFQYGYFWQSVVEGAHTIFSR